MKNIINNYDIPDRIKNIEQKVNDILKKSNDLYTVENLKLAFNLIDLTTLNADDTLSKGKTMAEKVSNFNNNFNNIPNVAAICVYPSLVPVVRKNLSDKNIKIASVTAGFPASQTFIAIKIAESQMAIDKGADEIDIVISLGTFLEKDYDTVFKEISLIKQTVGENHVKVILETGILKTPEKIRIASIIAMEAGADFIKTSTGKLEPAATLEAVYVMTQAIKDFYDKTGKKIGIKPAGGLSTPQDAINYLAIVKNNLGNEWLNNKLFRIGASRLANNLLTEIAKLENNSTEEIKYF